MNSKNVWVYCVHGNHEEYPANITSMKLIYDENVQGEVFYEEDYPMIRYFVDGGEYVINNHSVLVVGGAYSVDKYYRLSKAKNSNGWTGWFESEQLTKDQQEAIKANVEGKHYDLVLTHTCPISWEPTDLFLSFVDQSTVDKTMELFLFNLKNHFTFDIWTFGHYHDDRLVRPGVEMYFTDIEKLDTIFTRWENYKTTGQLEEWWLKKGPLFYAKEEEL